jgi:hypothetical protein
VTRSLRSLSVSEEIGEWSVHTLNGEVAYKMHKSFVPTRTGRKR